MATNQTNKITNKKPSALEKFAISFEYDRTWVEAKNTVQMRPSKH